MEIIVRGTLRCALTLAGLACGLAFIGCNRVDEPAPAVVAPQPVDLAALKQRAESGNAAARRELGEAYLHASGKAQDYTLAFEWLSKAAQQGDTVAQYDLGQLYEAGQGIKQSYGDALTWYRKAADQGHTDAQFALAVLYAFGRGTPMNDAEAARWYLKAAEGGEPLAQFNIGQRYQAGRGVPTDLVEAYKWLTFATKEVPDSVTMRDELKGRMSREQLAEAKRRLAEFESSRTPSPKR